MVQHKILFNIHFLFTRVTLQILNVTYPLYQVLLVYMKLHDAYTVDRW